MATEYKPGDSFVDKEEQTYYITKKNEDIKIIAAKFGTYWKVIYDWNRDFFGRNPHIQLDSGIKLRVR